MAEAAAERTEERDPAERNAEQADPPRTPSRTEDGTNGPDRVRGAARKDGKLKFTALLHHADVAALRRSFFKLKKTAAAGIDGRGQVLHCNNSSIFFTSLRFSDFF